jgi:hypothetical protein
VTKLLLRKSRTRADFDLFRRSTPLIQETLRKSAQSVFTGHHKGVTYSKILKECLVDRIPGSSTHSIELFFGFIYIHVIASKPAG